MNGRCSSHFCSDLVFSQRAKRSLGSSSPDGRQAGKEAGEEGEEARDPEAGEEAFVVARFPLDHSGGHQRGVAYAVFPRYFDYGF
jgi:hypothetical protein